jgi:predicted dehydrogenase
VTEAWLVAGPHRLDTAPVSRRLGVGVLGCGHVSDQYFRGCREFDLLHVLACADAEPERARLKAAEHGVPRPCTPDELLADPDVELVVNLTPPQAHGETSLAAIRAGKHVWSEKPLAATLEDAARLVEAAREGGVRLGCAPDTFLGGALQTSIKLLDDGWVGEPLSSVALVSEHGYEHFHPAVQAFYAPGGGPALDLGPYYVTALVALLGPVARVTGVAHRPATMRIVPAGPRRGDQIPVRVPTHVTGALEFAGGAVATVLMSWDIWATRLPYLEVYGTAGSLSVPNPDEFGGLPLLRRAGDEELRQPPPPPGTVTWTAVPLAYDGHVGRGIGVADIAHALESGRPHRASGELAYHVLEVLTSLERSHREGVAVEIASRCARPVPLPLGLLKGRLD